VIYQLHPEAAAEHRKQVAYYEDRQIGLGKRYHAEFRSVLAIVCEAPQRFRVIGEPSIRRLHFTVFPFDLIYREVGGSVQILAIAHHRREPGYWLGRI
jgi:plasmid stabilization system protein ParE